MKDICVAVENISKSYRLGVIGRKTLQEELLYWWHKVRGRDPGRFLLPLDQLENRAPERLEQNQRFWALKDVSFEVERGEVLGIIGCNGAGKSTLLKILTRITEPTTGTAILDGHVASLLEVGTGFHPELTGRDNVFLNGAILGMKKQEISKKFDGIVAFSGVGPFIDTPVKRYSSGMRVRLAFAVAAHLDPEILLIDEVLAVGDIGFQKKCLGRMGELSKSGRTILFVSHNMKAVSSLCPQTMWIHDGRIRASGLSGDVIRQYVTAMSQDEEGKFGRRRGSGSVRITKISLEDAEGKPCEAVSSGSEAAFVIDYRLRGSSQRVELNLIVINEEKVRLFSLGNRFTGTELYLEPNGRIRCRIPRVPLQPGSYSVVAICRQGSEILDKVSELSGFAVVEGDYFGSGALPGRQFGELLVEHNWEYVMENPQTDEVSVYNEDQT